MMRVETDESELATYTSRGRGRDALCGRLVFRLQRIPYCEDGRGDMTCGLCGRPEDVHERGEIEAEFEGRDLDAND